MSASFFSFRNVYRAYLDCRKKKRGKLGSLTFEVDAERRILELAQELTDRSYQPRPSFCFVAKNDKYREVFAAAFRDRIVHHLLVRCLEIIWEPIFIFDAYASRRSKGTHAAVRRLQGFIAKVTANGSRRAWVLQCDISAFFPSIDRGILLKMVLNKIHHPEIRWLSELLIRHDPTLFPVYQCSPEKWRHILPQKSLFGVEKGKGLPIGNLTSQFFANVYLNALDQFVKHELKSRWYMRYVDDFVLLHPEREVLYEWRNRIEEFLLRELALNMHPHRRRIRSVSNGIDFLGYVTHMNYRLVRRNTVVRFKNIVARWDKHLVSHSPVKTGLIIEPEKYRKVRATTNAYLGVMRHADTQRLITSVFIKSQVLSSLFHLDRFRVTIRWECPRRIGRLTRQFRFFRNRYSGPILFQVGCYVELFDRDVAVYGAILNLKAISPRKGFQARCGFPLKLLSFILERMREIPVMLVLQTDGLSGNLIQRELFRIEYLNL